MSTNDKQDYFVTCPECEEETQYTTEDVSEDCTIECSGCFSEIQVECP